MTIMFCAIAAVTAIIGLAALWLLAEYELHVLLKDERAQYEALKEAQKAIRRDKII